MRVYLDNCCLNRPFDDQSQDKVRWETEAVLSILGRCASGKWNLIGSDVIKLEIMKNPNDAKRQILLALYETLAEGIKYNGEIGARAILLRENGIKPFDSLHLAFAEYAKADIFLTTDQRLLKAAMRSDVRTYVDNPANYYMEVLNREQFGPRLP